MHGTFMHAGLTWRQHRHDICEHLEVFLRSLGRIAQQIEDHKARKHGQAQGASSLPTPLCGLVSFKLASTGTAARSGIIRGCTTPLPVSATSTKFAALRSTSSACKLAAQVCKVAAPQQQALSQCALQWPLHSTDLRKWKWSRCCRRALTRGGPAQVSPNCQNDISGHCSSKAVRQFQRPQQERLPHGDPY